MIEDVAALLAVSRWGAVKGSINGFEFPRGEVRVVIAAR
jgi:hypothetical protein